MDQRGLTARQFGAMAARYLTSGVHAGGADLEHIAQLAARIKPLAAVDLGCGAGHASFALARGGASHVTAYDLSEQMLEIVAAQAAVRGYDTAAAMIETRQGAAEALPFADASVDLIVTRFSAHHWLDVSTAVREVARILRQDGTFLVIDVLAPETALFDTVLQTLEILRDASHVRNYRASEWISMLDAAGFAAPATHAWKLPMNFANWVERIGTPPARIAALRSVLEGLPAEAGRYIALQEDGSFVIDAGSFEVKKASLAGPAGAS